jgi:hypothetical protein
MSKLFTIIYVLYLIISSFFIDIEHKNLRIHVLNATPVLFLLYIYLKKKHRYFLLEDYLIIIPLALFPVSEAIIYFFSSNQLDPLIVVANGIYFFLLHVCFIITLRNDGAKLLTFTNMDYYKTFPFLIVVFLVFGYLFLPVIPIDYLFLMMLISSMIAIILAHIMNFPVNGINYNFKLYSSILLAVSDFFTGYVTFLSYKPIYYIISRNAFLMMLMLLAVNALKKNILLNPQKHLFLIHKS